MKTETERRNLLSTLGLDPDAPALGHMPVTLSNDEVKDLTKRQPKLAPSGVDPHTMPVTDIVFDPALLDDFESLEGQGLRAAADHVFAFYKSPGRNKERNRPLWGEVGKFITRVRQERETGVPHVKEKVRGTKKQRDLLALMSEMGITSVEDLTSLLGKTEE